MCEMKRRIIACLLGSALPFALGLPASAGLIDFESEPVGPVAGGTLTIVSSGINVTFTGPGLQIRQFGTPFPNTRVLSTTVDAGPITVTFQTGFTAPFVQMENIIDGRFTGEIDIIDGTAFDVGNNVLDFQSNSNTIHTLTGPGIASAVYVENFLGQGFVMDNFFFIPEPATSILLAFGGLFLIRRRR